MEQIAVSIIVPVYNTQAYLKKCVDSILTQTFQNFELILVDDGSTDGSSAICDGYQRQDSRVHVVHKENCGPCVARNTGLELAQGKYIYFVDSDDYIEPTLLEKTITVMDRHHSDWCCFGMIKEDSKGNFIENVAFIPNEITIKNENERLQFLLKYLLNYRIGWEQCTHIFRGDIIRENQLYFEGERVAFGEDLLFSFTYWLYAQSCVVIEDLLYHYVQHESSLMWHSQFRNVLPEVHKLAKNAYKSVTRARKKIIQDDFAIIYYHLMEWHARPYVSRKGIEWVKSEIQKLSYDQFLSAESTNLLNFCHKFVKRYGKDSGFVTVVIAVMYEATVPQATAFIKAILEQTIQKLDIFVLSPCTWDLHIEDARIRQITINDAEPDSIIRMLFEESYGEYIYFADCNAEIPAGYLERMSDVLKYNGCSTVIVAAEEFVFVNMNSLYDRKAFRKFIREKGISRQHVMCRTNLLEESGLACMDNLQNYTEDIILSGHAIIIQENL